MMDGRHREDAGNTASGCGKFGSGHDVHWIRARKMLHAEDLVTPSAVRVHDNTVSVEVEDVVHRGANHRPDLIAAALEQTPTESVRFTRSRRGLLVGRAIFGLCLEPDDLGECGDGSPNGAVTGYVPVDPNST